VTPRTPQTDQQLELRNKPQLKGGRGDRGKRKKKTPNHKKKRLKKSNQKRKGKETQKNKQKNKKNLKKGGGRESKKSSASMELGDQPRRPTASHRRLPQRARSSKNRPRAARRRCRSPRRRRARLSRRSCAPPRRQHAASRRYDAQPTKPPSANAPRQQAIEEPSATGQDVSVPTMTQMGRPRSRHPAPDPARLTPEPSTMNAQRSRARRRCSDVLEYSRRWPLRWSETYRSSSHTARAQNTRARDKRRRSHYQPMTAARPRRDDRVSRSPRNGGA